MGQNRTKIWKNSGSVFLIWFGTFSLLSPNTQQKHSLNSKSFHVQIGCNWGMSLELCLCQKLLERGTVWIQWQAEKDYCTDSVTSWLWLPLQKKKIHCDVPMIIIFIYHGMHMVLYNTMISYPKTCCFFGKSLLCAQWLLLSVLREIWCFFPRW